MQMPPATDWDLIRDAASGSTAARELFAQRYLPAVRAVLAARWRRPPLAHLLEDAIQECFVECFKVGGSLDRADPDFGQGFRAYLVGVARNVAKRFEERGAREQRRREAAADPDQVARVRTTVSQAMDREWARLLVRQAAAEMRRRADQSSDAAKRRVELLTLRFSEGLPIREIADRWGVEPSYVHHQYAKARKGFLASLLVVLRRQFPAAPGSQIEALAAQLVDLLQ